MNDRIPDAGDETVGRWARFMQRLGEQIDFFYFRYLELGQGSDDLIKLAWKLNGPS
jgi:hypothetical protein